MAITIMGAKDDSRVVGYVVDLDALCRELNMAVEPGEAMGSRILDVRGGDNHLCNARSDKVVSSIAFVNRLQPDSITEESGYNLIYFN